MDSGAGVKWLVPVVFEVLVAPVQDPQTGGPGVVQAGDREAGPVGSDILAPRRPAFANGQMPWGDVAFDADLAADALGNLAGTPTLDAGDVQLRKPGVGHVAMIAAQRRTGYAGASIPVCWTLSKASAGVIQPSTRQGRWLSLAATELSWSWLNLPRSAFLCRYWRSSRLVSSLVPRCQGWLPRMVRVAEEYRHRQRRGNHGVVGHLQAAVPRQGPP